jgi:hypothetical protein
MGGSYGGYATLVGLTFTPELFACGVDIVGPSNLETLLETIPPYWAPMVKQFHERMGNPTTPEGLQLLKDCSPIHKADKIVRPLLIGQGANDPRVKQSESDQIVAAMQGTASRSPMCCSRRGPRLCPARKLDRLQRGGRGLPRHQPGRQGGGTERGARRFHSADPCGAGVYRRPLGLTPRSG